MNILSIKTKSLTNEALQTMFLKLFNARNTEELDALIENDSTLSKAEWKHYGGIENNLGTFRAQQNNSVAALIEKITNGIDSILINKCIEHGIDPKSEEAPKTMKDAINYFFGINNGQWKDDFSAKERKEIASNLQVVASGNKSDQPNITIYDNGEGQHPEDFARTFLSLHSNNKINIPFVQGQFNMGSAGAVIFCAGKHYQLIASKKAFSEDGKSNQFGFTLVRKHQFESKDEEEKTKASWYEYLTIDGDIPSFDLDETGIDLGLVKRNFQSGSLVKLYSYQLPRNTRSVIAFGLWKELNQYLYDPAIPFLTFEDRRKNDGSRMYNGNTFDKITFGNKTRISDLEKEQRCETFSFKTDSHEIGEMTIQAHVLSNDVNRNEYIGEKAVVFSVNGQVQGHFPRRFISQELGLNFIRDHMLIHVDCTKMRKSFREEIFMSSRDRLSKDSYETNLVKDKLIDILKSDEQLKDINDSRKDAIRQNDNQEDADLLKQITSKIPMNKDLLKLFQDKGDLRFLKGLGENNKSKAKKKTKRERKYAPKFYPMVLDLISDKNVNIPLNRKGVWTFETDAEDDFITRNEHPGKIQVLNVYSNENVTDSLDVNIIGPRNGLVKVELIPKANTEIGMKKNFIVTLESSEFLAQPINLEVVSSALDKKKKRKKDDDKDKNNQSSLPNPSKIYKEQWDELQMTGEDVVKLGVDTIEGQSVLSDVIINMDSDILSGYMKGKRLKTANQIRAIQDQYFLQIYLHSIFLYASMDKTTKDKEVELSNLELDEMINEMLKSYGMFLLTFNSNDAMFKMMND